MKSRDLVVIGGGSAGLAAAISAYENGVKDILILERNSELGGILNQCIHNGFGLHKFKEELTGPEYARKFIDKLAETGIECELNTQVLEISKDRVVTFMNPNGFDSIEAKCIIFACGCNERTRGQISIPGNRPKGVYTAGLAQKYINIDGSLVGKKVYILGSGDIGLITARRMTLEGATVLGVSELMPYSNGLNRNIVQCLNDFNIPLRLSNTVTNIYGKDKLTGIEICDVDDKLQPIKGRETYIECDTLLLSVGLYPFNTLLKNAGCEVYKATKGSKVDQNLETSVNGIFACGNVLHVHDLVDFVSEESEKAGKNAADLIINGRKEVVKTYDVTPKNLIGYVVPSVIHATNDLNEVTFSFRVRKPIKKGKIIFKDGETVIKSIMKVDLIPSEMQKISVKDVDYKSLNSLSLEIEEL